MRYLLIVLLSVFISATCPAQIRVNNTIDPSDTELNTAVKFFNNYIDEFSITKQFLPDFTKYWSAEDCLRYRIPDRLIYAINTEIPTYMMGKPTILMAKPENGRVHIKTMFSNTDSAGNIFVFAITNHYIERSASGTLHFVNPMQLSAAEWRTTEVNNLIYHYPAYHQFSKKKAKELTDQIDKLEKDWNLLPILIQYYFADTKEEIEHYRGFDFTLAMGNRDKPSGISDGVDNIIYCGGMGENYFHEVVHLYLNKLFPKSPLNEGLAVFYGGSLGHELTWHIKRVSQYLDRHPEIDMNKPDEFYYMDNNTNPLSTLQGMLCLLAYNKDGMEGLRRTMKYTSIESLLLKEYNVQRGDWNRFFREQLKAIK